MKTDVIGAVSVAPTAPPRRSFLLWSGAGTVFLLLQAYAYIAWIASSDFRPTLPGPDPIPAVVRISTIAYEIIAMATLVPAVIWFAHGIYKTGKIDTTRAMMLGWLSAYWLDPFLDFLRPMFTYNAYAVNFGCWCNHIPFWRSPNGARIAEPLLIIAPSYFFSFAGTALIALWFMRRAKASWPGLGNFGLALAGFTGVWVSMSILDVVATRYMGLDAWPGSFQAVSFWGGQFYQFPFYELVLFPSPFVACAFLIYYADADGYTVIERGIAQLRGVWWRNSLRVLAFIAFCNLLNLTYTGAMGIHAGFADPWPAKMPSWLADEQCGGVTGLACRPQ